MSEEKPAMWPQEYAVKHLTETFQQACRRFPDLMEPYMSRLEGGEGDMEIMRAGLRETIMQRYQ